jgi:hypothetical protein
MSERFNLVSEVAFDGDAPRPIHILRVGEFTANSGRTFAFTPEHLAAIVQNFQAGRRKKPPITERHDFGRAVGRITRVWTDEAGANLYAQPTWNKAGSQLLADEVYDGFSCELDGLDAQPFLIGGSLTNYPAVDGLQAVTLEAPIAAGGPRVDTQPPTQENTRMSEEVLTTPPVLPPADMSAEVQAAFAQMRSDYERQLLQMVETERANFQRQLEADRTASQIAQFAQHITTPTIQRQHALPLEADAVTAFLSSLSASQRDDAKKLFSRILDAGLVSFEEIGSSAEGGAEPSAKERFEAAVAAKVATGMSRFNAITAIGKEQPALYAEYRGGK